MPEGRATGRKSDVAVIDAARRHVDERFGPSSSDVGLVALYLVGLDREQIASVLGYRPEAAAVGLRRALSRSPDGHELTWARPDQEFAEKLVADIRSERQPTSGRRRRSLAIAAGLTALLAVGVTLGALLTRSDDSPSSGVLGANTSVCRNLAAELNKAYARHAEEQEQLIRRHVRERRRSFGGLSARQRAAFEERQYREQEALLARQNREIGKLEAQRC